MAAPSKTAEALRFCPTPTASTSSSTRPAFKGHTLLLPTIAHASIPQLATDLLLSTGERLSLVHVGSLDAGQDLIPFVGGRDASGSSSSSAASGISTPLDVFTSTRYPVTVLQQRSPVLRSRRAGFAKRLARWVRQEGFGRVVVLSSLDKALRDDEELGGESGEEEGGMMHYLPSAGEGEGYKKLAAALKKAGSPVSLRVLVGGPATDQDADTNDQLRIQPPSSTSSASRQTTSSQPHLPSSSTGLTSRYLSALSDSDTTADLATTPAAAPVPSGALLLWAAEGDNRGDAHRMARCVLEEVLPALGVETSPLAGGKGVGGGEAQQQQPLNEPPSWKGLYGNAYDQALFG